MPVYYKIRNPIGTFGMLTSTSFEYAIGASDSTNDGFEKDDMVKMSGSAMSKAGMMGGFAAVSKYALSSSVYNNIRRQVERKTPQENGVFLFSVIIEKSNADADYINVLDVSYVKTRAPNKTIHDLQRCYSPKGSCAILSPRKGYTNVQLYIMVERT